MEARLEWENKPPTGAKWILAIHDVLETHIGEPRFHPLETQCGVDVLLGHLEPALRSRLKVGVAQRVEHSSHNPFRELYIFFDWRTVCHMFARNSSLSHSLRPTRVFLSGVSCQVPYGCQGTSEAFLGSA